MSPTMSNLKIGIATLLLAAGAANGQCGDEYELHANPSVHMELFGGAVSLNSSATDTMFIGARSHDLPSKADAGVAYYWARLNDGTWSQQQMLQSDAPVVDGLFGAAVHISYPWAMVGEPGVASQTGAVHFFERSGNTWIHRQRITPPGTLQSELVGQSISMNEADTLAIIGCPNWDVTDNGQLKINVGRAIIYRRSGTTWSPEFTVTEPAAARHFNDYLGESVSMSGTWAAVGIPSRDTNGVSRGAVAMYLNNFGTNWVQGQMIVPPADAEFSKFGGSVDVKDDRLIVGATDWDDLPGYVRPGKAYVFVNMGGVWVLDGQLLSPKPTSDGYFGIDVRIEGDYALVRSARYDGNDDDTVHLYKRRGPGDWTCERTWNVPNDPHSYGSAIDLRSAGDGIMVAVGDPTDQVAATLPGSVHIYDQLSVSGADECDSAPSVGLGSYTDCTTFATTSASNPAQCTANAIGKDIWYAFTASCDQTIEFNTEGSTFDTVLSLHIACGLPSIACDDDGGTGTTSRLLADLDAGQTVLVRIAGYNTASGSSTLNIIERPPVNDSCAAAMALSSGSVTGCTRGATAQIVNPGSCLSQGADVWFSYTAGCDGPVTVSTQGSSFDTVLSVHTGCPGDAFALTLGCNDDFAFPQLWSQMTFNANSGSTYRIRLGGYGVDDKGQYLLTLTDSCVPPTCPCDWNGVDGLDSQDFFDFLDGFFNGNADFNGVDGTDSQDYFDFLECFFTGCP